MPPSRIIEVQTLTTALDEMKRGLRSFRKYVPADLVRELLASGQEAEIGGKRLELTIHFSDIVGFTSVAESLPPEQLVLNLGEYLEEMSEHIAATGGTVDKYIGDAIMAFWGAPRPDADHALHACEAALENRDRLDALNARWEAAGRPRFDARVALHTGEVVVGNVGSGARLNYTVIGDAVNLASRLESLNKRYGTRLMISETTWARVSHAMVARPLDKVSVKGKAASVVIYELLGRKSRVSADALEAADRHAQAFSLYLERRWSEAIVVLREQLERRPSDGPTRILLERCERWAASPAPSDWDGIERMTEK
jgi:adenylate cyclase